MLKINCITLPLLIVCLAHPVHAANKKVAIASAHPLATAAGFEMIEKGGNVFDAAVAVSAALAVVEPWASGLGGGAYWLLHRQQDGMETVIDAREKAPLAAKKTLFLDSKGAVIPNLSREGGLAAAIPGMPAGMVHLAEKYGRLPLGQSLAPAIRYAKNGFAIGGKYLKLLKIRLAQLKQDPAASRVFLDRGNLPKPFSILRQPELSETLSAIAESGKAGFYDGEVADKLVAGVKNAGGIWTKADLLNYQIVERKPIKGVYKGIHITSVPSSSSGGTVLMETLNILSGFDLHNAGSVTRKHLVTEAMRRAYHDRALYLGDSDFVSLPTERLLSQHYAASLRQNINPHKATPSKDLAAQTPAIHEGTDTTHFSIIDEDGNRVAATLSINYAFGAGFVAPETGVVLNDEMDDFVSLPGAQNGYGLVGGEANAIAPGKRMLSSMSPTFLETPERAAVLGTPGGSKIISMVLLGILDFAEGKDPQSWVKVPRLHHQYLPDVLEYEKNALTPEEQKALTAMGHTLKPAAYAYGDMQAVQLNKQTKELSAASDPRGEGQGLTAP